MNELERERVELFVRENLEKHLRELLLLVSLFAARLPFCCYELISIER